MKNKFKFLATMLMGVMLSTNVWGATYTKVTSAPTDWSGEYMVVAIFDQSVLSWNGLDAGQNGVSRTISNNQITADDVITITIATGSDYSIMVNGGTNNGKYIGTTNTGNPSYSNGLKFADAAQPISIEMDGNGAVRMYQTTTSDNMYLLYNKNTGVNNERFRFYKNTNLDGENYKTPYLFKKEPDCTTDLATPVVTATAGNGSATLTWGAVANATKYQVSWNGGAYTDATSPYEKSGLTNGTQYTWKVKAIGGGEYCDSEEATGNVTPSANHTVTWYVDGFEYTTGSPTTEVVHGGKVAILPTQPAVPTACTGSVFVGWTDHTVTNGNKPSPLFKDAASAPVVNANVNYHAVFADPE